MAKQLTLYNCAKKRRRVSEPEESDICGDGGICEIIRDSDDDVSSLQTHSPACSQSWGGGGTAGISRLSTIYVNT